MLAGNCFELDSEPGAPQPAALAFFALAWDGRGIRTEFLPDSRGSGRGHSLAALPEECGSASCLPVGSTVPILREACAPRPLAPRSYRDVGKDQKNSQP